MTIAGGFTCEAGSEKSTSMHNASRLKSSITLNNRTDAYSGQVEQRFRKGCRQGVLEQKLSFEGRHLFDSPNKPAAKRSTAVIMPTGRIMTVHLAPEYVSRAVRNRCSFTAGICNRAAIRQLVMHEVHRPATIGPPTPPVWHVPAVSWALSAS